WVVIIVSLVIVSAVAIALIIAVLWPRTDSPPPPGMLVRVSSNGEEGTVKNLEAAFRQIKAGGHIIVLDDFETHPRHIHDLPKNVTIEPDGDQRVVWRLSAAWQPENTDKPEKPRSRFLTLGPLDGLHIRGFTIDGSDKIDDLVVLFGKCPGVTLENV